MKPRRKPNETLARARFDQRTAQEQVQLASRFAATNSTSQSFGITRRRQTSERDAGIGHVLLDLLEVAQLFARKARQTIREIEILRVREDEAEGGRGRLLLAIRMIEKELLPALARDVEPLGIRLSAQR